MKKSDSLTFPRVHLSGWLGLTQVPLSVLMFLAAIALLLNMVVMARFESAIGFLFALVGNLFLVNPREVTKFFNWIQNWGRKYNLNIAALLFVFVGAVFILNYMADPAAAQFFNKTEQWLKSSFPESQIGVAPGLDIYSLVFNTLRAFFVSYLAVALAKVISAARNDEDWQNMARIPLIILITVVMGDVLAGVITGNGNGGGGASP